MQDLRENGPGFESLGDTRADEEVGMQVDTGNVTEIEQAARRKMKHIISLMQE